MAFSTSTPSVIVGAWSLRTQGCEGPHVPGRGQSLVLDGPGHNHVAAAAGSCDGSRAGVCLHGSGVREAFAVVSDLGEDACSRKH